MAPPSASQNPEQENAALKAEIATLQKRLEEANSYRRTVNDQTLMGLAVLDASSDSIMLLDASGTIRAVNKVGASFLRASRTDLLGSNVFDKLPEALRRDRKRWLKEAVDTLRPVQFKDSYRGSDYGHMMFPEKLPGTGALRVTVITRDITGSEKALRALRESEARYRAMVDDHTEFICRFDGSGHITYVNEAFVRYYGTTRDEAIGQQFVGLTAPDDPDSMQRSIDSLNHEGPVMGCEQRIGDPHDGARWQYWTLRALVNQEKQITGYQAMGRSITKRKQAEAELREHRAFLRQVIDTVPNLIFVKNREGTFSLVNQAMADLYGGTVDELVGKRGEHFNPNEDETSVFRAEDLEVLESREPLFIPQRAITNAQGETRWFATVKLPLVETDHVLGVAVDITERKQAETERAELEAQIRQSQKMQALGTLAGGIAHDFNNMIFAILGFARLALKRTEPESKMEEYLEYIQSAGLRASELVRQILTFSRRSDQEKQPLRLTPLCREMVKMIRATVPTTITIEEVCEAEADCILGDATQIHQVLMNLCTNAAHAMRDTGGVLRLTMRNTRIEDEATLRDLGQPMGEFVDIRVSDTGHGIAPDIQEKIFDPFFTTKRPGEGTGMGLSVVHGIVKSHGGSIRVASRLGHGTTFRILLPALEEAAATGAVEDEAPVHGSERILFVDDEELIVNMARDMLTELGYTVHAMTDPMQAMETFLANPSDFDLIITDQTMPQLTGEALARRVLAAHPRMPIILLTGFSEQITAERAREMGISEFVMKPLVEARLAQVIRSVLDRRPQDS